MSDDTTVERIELARLAGKMLGPLEYLKAVHSLRNAEGIVNPGLFVMVRDLQQARDRIVALSRELPEGPLEAFAREHPMHEDQLDGPYCGYGVKDGGKPFSCPVRNAKLHWDAWEMMGTDYKRPDHAK